MESKSLETLAALLTQRPDVRAVDKQGLTALQVAVALDVTEHASMLLRSGARLSPAPAEAVSLVFVALRKHEALAQQILRVQPEVARWTDATGRTRTVFFLSSFLPFFLSFKREKKRNGKV